MGCGADTEANALLTSLLTGEDTTLPVIDFNSDIFKIPDEILENLTKVQPRIENKDLTEVSLDGSGVFDLLMRSYKAHLKQEYDSHRITGNEYTKAYIALTESAMSQSVQFLVSRDAAYWQSATAQMQALTARTQAQIAMMQLATAKFEALTSKASYGLTKMKIATEDQAYCTAKFNLDVLLPKQGNLLDAQIAQQEAQTDTAVFTLGQILPQQKLLLVEQTEVQRAQTLDTRADGANIVGAVGKQKDLYNQQITSYQRDAEVKAAKLFTDAWITQKTMDEALAAPNGFTNTSIDTILTALKTNNNLN